MSAYPPSRLVVHKADIGSMREDLYTWRYLCIQGKIVYALSTILKGFVYGAALVRLEKALRMHRSSMRDGFCTQSNDIALLLRLAYSSKSFPRGTHT